MLLTRKLIMNMKHKIKTQSSETVEHISKAEIASFLHEHLVAFRKITFAIDWHEMVYYLEMASTEAEAELKVEKVNIS